MKEVLYLWLKRSTIEFAGTYLERRKPAAPGLAPQSNLLMFKRLWIGAMFFRLFLKKIKKDFKTESPPTPSWRGSQIFYFKVFNMLKYSHVRK